MLDLIWGVSVQGRIQGGGSGGSNPPFQYAFKLHSLMSNYNTLVVTCVQLIANEVWFCQLYFTVRHTHDMGVTKGVVIGVASRTPTIQNSWIRPCRSSH